VYNFHVRIKRLDDYTVECPVCDGSGVVDCAEGVFQCPACSGFGTLVYPVETAIDRDVPIEIGSVQRFIGKGGNIDYDEVCTAAIAKVLSTPPDCL